MGRALPFAILIIIAGLIAFLSLKSFTSANDMVTGKDEEAHETRTEAAQHAVDDLNQKTQEAVDRYNNLN